MMLSCSLPANLDCYITYFLLLDISCMSEFMLNGSNKFSNICTRPLLPQKLCETAGPFRCYKKQLIVDKDSVGKMYVISRHHWNYHYKCYFAGAKAKRYDVKEVLGLLASGFIKAGKGSSAVEMVRGASAINREIRVGITHVSYIAFCRSILTEKL